MKNGLWITAVQRSPLLSPIPGGCSAEIFVATLGASNYTFATACWTERRADWVDAHVKVFEFFGVVPEIIVPDQLRSAVSKPCRYEPAINASYKHMASHYRTAVIPARPLKPKDKAKAENAVLIVQRWTCDYAAGFVSHKAKYPEFAFPQSIPGLYESLDPMSDVIESYTWLHEHPKLDFYILTAPSIKNPHSYAEKRIWVEKYLGMADVENLIISPH